MIAIVTPTFLTFQTFYSYFYTYKSVLQMDNLEEIEMQLRGFSRNPVEEDPVLPRLTTPFVQLWTRLRYIIFL